MMMRFLIAFLIAIGVGKLVSKLKLPAILGWLLAGMILGPHAIGLINQSLLDSVVYGRIINISSVGGIQAGPAQVSYFAAKGGVVNLTKAMAGDLAPYGILVNAIAPGVYDTEMTHDALDAPGSLVLKNRVALKRFGREGEMNGALIYFASDACTYTTGQLLVIDGGMTSML